MFEGILLSIKNLVEEIYSVDQRMLDKNFVDFLDEMVNLIRTLEKSGFQIDISKEMGKLQMCYEKRDLVELSDFLLYEIKPDILELENMVKNTCTED